MHAQQAQWLGSIRIARSPGFTAVTAAALCIAVALVYFAASGQVARKVTLPGVLLPIGGLLHVSAPQAGVIAQWLVQEGAQVQPGQALLHIRNDRHTAQGEAGLLAQVAIGQRRSSLESEVRLVEQQGRLRQDALAERLRSLRADERQTVAETTSAHHRVQLARQTLARYQDLTASGFMSVAQTQQREEELLDAQTRHTSAARSAEALLRDIQTLLSEQAAHTGSVRASIEPLRRALAALNQEQSEHATRRGITVAAPQAGRISTRLQAVGQSIQAGQTLANLIPTAPDQPAHGSGSQSDSMSAASPDALEAVLFAPSRASGFVALGQVVWLRYAAYPYQKFGMAQGVVHAVSDSPVSPQDLPAGLGPSLMAASRSNEPLRRINVRLAHQHIQAVGSTHMLKAGASVEADVMQEHRKVWEWLFEPLLASRQQANKFLNPSPNTASPGG